jgi:hypothetical protein
MEITWNYRVIAKKIYFKNQVEIQFGIHEVHYKNDVPSGCSENPMSLSTSSVHFDQEIDPIEFLNWQIEALKVACEKPVLDYDNFPNEYLKYSRKKKLKMLEKYLK